VASVLLALTERSQEAESQRTLLDQALSRIESQKFALGELESEVNSAQCALDALEDQLENVRSEHEAARREADEASERELAGIQKELDEARAENALAEVSMKKIMEHAQKMERERNDSFVQASQEQKENEHVIFQLQRELRAVAEFWKAPPRPLMVKRIKESSSMVEKVAGIFRSCSHLDSWYMCSLTKQFGLSKCSAFQQLRVVAAETLHNPDLWAKYCHCKEAMSKRHRALGVRVNPLVPSIDELLPIFQGLSLDIDVNESLLVHGCTEKAANAIIIEGFDIRHAKTHGGCLYGEGIYFAKQMCKSNQYTDQSGPSGLRHIIISRVALGDPKYLSGGYSGRLPPFRDDSDETKGRHDSNVVNPQDSVRGQTHWECVLFNSEQAYPEMLITYEIP